MTNDEVNEQELDRFEARFFGTMPEQEAAAFDAELDRDAALRDRFSLFVLTVRGIRSGEGAGAASGAAALRDRFSAIDRELDTPRTVVRTMPRPWMGWAAAVLVLLGVGAIWWSGRSESPPELATEFAVLEPGLPVLMGTSPRTLDAIMNAYKQKDLPTAAALLDGALTRDGGNDTLHYFRGVVADMAGAEDLARAQFGQVPSGSVFHIRATYRAAMSHLRTSEVGVAGQLLEEVAASADPVLAAKARELLVRLRNQ